MVRRGPIAMDIKPLEELPSEVGEELGSTIGDNIDREAVVFPDMPTVQLRRLFCGNIRSTRNKMSHFCETICERGTWTRWLGRRYSWNRRCRQGRSVNLETDGRRDIVDRILYEDSRLADKVDYGGIYT